MKSEYFMAGTLMIIMKYVTIMGNMSRSQKVRKDLQEIVDESKH